MRGGALAPEDTGDLSTDTGSSEDTPEPDQGEQSTQESPDTESPDISAEADPNEDPEALLTAETPDTDEPEDEEPEDNEPSFATVTVYRLYNPYSGEHLFTTSISEYTDLAAIGWRQEGVAFLVPDSGDTPVYRLYNPYSGDHHYTTSKSEYDSLKTIGWRQEGIAYYSASSDTGVAIYRFFNPYETIGTHHYTTSVSERLSLTAHGWKYEGVGWYALATGSEATTGLLDENGTLVYKDSDGSYYTGLKTINGYTYYFDGEKGLISNSLQEAEGKTYWFNENGVAQTGWVKINGTWSYLDSNGNLQSPNESVSSAQSKIVSAAKSTAATAPGYCSEWVSKVYRNAGLGYPEGDGNTILNGATYYTFGVDNLSTLCVGMAISAQYGSSSVWGQLYGHVCIYIGGGKVMDSAYGLVRTMDLGEWMTTYNQGWIRWGYPKVVAAKL